VLTGGALANDTFFGTSDDAPMIQGKPTPASRIASVTIKGQVLESASTSDHYGIVAGRIDAVSIGGVALALTKDLDVIDVTGTNGATDLTVREVSFLAS
jgi:hypothetical protein